MMPANEERDEIIVVEETLELEQSGYFYLENRQFIGPFASPTKAKEAAMEHCLGTAPGECRAVYEGTVRFNPVTELNEALADMHQLAEQESLETLN
ncbi:MULTISPECIES: hypothetical protein [unclassified Oleiphilus]|uniref:hypothetical protein n=1 Tax=unclassified Oleiphilus TaxID=2631174 RepID=UPI0007C354B1|nr:MULTISPECIES: hypothetical protein [unclassified Oleiphilus]KZZ77548.1 hypothetical protein A3767_14850 [Oleiphilus sp. HI0133]KZZ80205.1 hypothetical protein A3767_30700 [Oleiphilus sp. HI0133]